MLESKFKCTSCKYVIINTKEDYRAHCKTEWHLFNQKRKLEVFFFYNINFLKLFVFN